MTCTTGGKVGPTAGCLILSCTPQVLKTTPKIMSDMVKDLQWIQEIDPATHGLLQPFLYFKGFHAVQIQRIGHSLWVKNDKTDKMLALSLQSRCAEVFGVDAHPGAVLSHSICMDHASGVSDNIFLQSPFPQLLCTQSSSCVHAVTFLLQVVIGETATIGHNCYILHGVTLGATGKAGTFDRHPKVTDPHTLLSSRADDRTPHLPGRGSSSIREHAFPVGVVMGVVGAGGEPC